ncbi:TonB family protein [Derxia gummosa]|uniref:TonB family protein n=1 Tax=Derxia gummosa DSM 723 TaxID=1121388 RepID=A0A8B6X3H8_9BURK|nr:TonB family protein [Derxia gummosa]
MNTLASPQGLGAARAPLSAASRGVPGLPPVRAGAQRALGLSLALHGLLAVGWVVAGMQFIAPAPPPVTAAIDLMNLLSQTQIEEKRQGEQAQPRPPQPANTPHPVERSKPQPHDAAQPPTPVKATTTQADSPVVTPTETAAQSAPPAPAAKPVGDADNTQMAQSSVPQETEADRLQRYLGKLNREIASHLSYPDEARQAGVHGEPLVSFVVLPSGELDPGSLRLVSSGGHPALDERALAAVRAAAPFEPPPRRLPIRLRLHFDADR